MPVSVEQLIQQLIAQITGSPEGAIAYALDPAGTTAAQGLDGGFPAGGIDVRQVVADYCNDPSVPYETRQALQSYTSGQSGPPGPAYNQADVVQHLNHVTYVTHENNQQVTNIIDQSRDVLNNTDINVGDDFSGDIDVDNATATGDNAAAANNSGSGDVNQATGDESQNVTGDNNQANTGDGAVLVGEDNNAPIVTGTNTGVISDGDIEAPIVFGDNTGIVNDNGTVQDNVLGDGNRVLNADSGGVSGPINFGDGAVTGSTLTNSQGVVGGDAQNTSGNQVGPGGALSGSGDASGTFEDNDETHTSTVHAENSNVGVEQGAGDQHQDFQQIEEFPDFPPTRMLEDTADPA